MDCEFCGKQFCSKYTLQIHQKTTKACISLQPEQPKPEEFICRFCLQDFSKKRFESHVKNCKERKDKLILELQGELQESKNLVSELQTKVLVLESRLRGDMQLITNNSFINPTPHQFEVSPEMLFHI